MTARLCQPFSPPGCSWGNLARTAPTTKLLWAESLPAPPHRLLGLLESISGFAFQGTEALAAIHRLGLKTLESCVLSEAQGFKSFSRNIYDGNILCRAQKRHLENTRLGEQWDRVGTGTEWFAHPNPFGDFLCVCSVGDKPILMHVNLLMLTCSTTEQQPQSPSLGIYSSGPVLSLRLRGRVTGMLRAGFKVL